MVMASAELDTTLLSHGRYMRTFDGIKFCSTGTHLEDMISNVISFNTYSNNKIAILMYKLQDLSFQQNTKLESNS